LFLEYVEPEHGNTLVSSHGNLHVRRRRSDNKLELYVESTGDTYTSKYPLVSITWTPGTKELSIAERKVLYSKYVKLLIPAVVVIVSLLLLFSLLPLLFFLLSHCKKLSVQWWK
jgi:hypothetical protein